MRTDKELFAQGRAIKDEKLYLLHAVSLSGIWKPFKPDPLKVGFFLLPFVDLSQDLRGINCRIELMQMMQIIHR